MSNLDRYKADIKELKRRGFLLTVAIRYETLPAERKRLEKALRPEDFKKLPRVSEEYQMWYSEALACLKQILPDRVSDFCSYYTSERARKNLTNENYTMSDYLKGLIVNTTLGETVVAPSAAIQRIEQQVQIVAAMEKRFESSLFDIRALVQADLFDNELDAAETLNKNGFGRGAGAVAGVVIAGHLAEICQRHGISITKKNPTISDLNDALKAKDVLEMATWRFIQHLADIRNKCDHKKSSDPTKEEVADLMVLSLAL
jgi:hypothetical protein